MKIDKIFGYKMDEKVKQKNHKGWINMNLTEEQTMSFTMRGDTKIIFTHNSKYGNQITICRIMFNTAFIQNGNYIVAGKMELSPEDIRKDKGKILPNDF